MTSLRFDSNSSLVPRNATCNTSDITDKSGKLNSSAHFAGPSSNVMRLPNNLRYAVRTGFREPEDGYIDV